MGKKVVITGVNGFIGSHMAQKCLQGGYDVIGIDINAITAVNEIHYYQLNLCENCIDDILKSSHPFALIHCAGMADVNYSVKYPDSDFESSVITTRRILYSLKNSSKETMFIFLSSAGVYGNPIKNPVDESHKKKPISPYALHKGIVEDICQYFVNQYNMDIRILRVFSAYGVGLKKQIFWDMGQRIRKNGRIELFGTGQETRDFIYIDDLIYAIQLVMETERTDEIIYNIADGIEISIKDVAEIFCRECGIKNEMISFNGYERQGNPINWCADISKIKKIGFVPKVDIDVGIQRYVEWLRQIEVIL